MCSFQSSTFHTDFLLYKIMILSEIWRHFNCFTSDFIANIKLFIKIQADADFSLLNSYWTTPQNREF